MPNPASPTLSRSRRRQSAGAGANGLARDGDATLAEQIAARYAERIGQRLLPPGARLPSVRDGARHHGVATSTVVAAYDQLVAQGFVEARPQRGFFVRAPRQPSATAPRHAVDAAAPADAAPRVRPVDATALIRGMFGAPHAQGPGMGTLPPSWLDLPLLQAAMRKALAGDDSALRYGDPPGDARLRNALSRRLGDFGIDAAPAQIVTACGATHALDLVARSLLRPGDAVLVDEPGWAIEFARLTRLGLRLLPVPRGEAGPDLEVMRQLVEAHRPRMYVTVSVLHNPTGCSLPLAAAHQVLKLAEAHDFWILEDDSYGHLAPPHLPRMAALDGLQRTLYVSGFSKVLAPNWRVGFVAAPQALVEPLVDAKLLSTLGTPTLTERALALTLEQGSLRRHAERLVQRLAAARSRVERLARDAGCRFVTPPAGLFGWVDVGIDTARLAQRLLDDGWLLAPGALFHVAPCTSTLMRINFATSQQASLWEAIAAQRKLP